MNKAVKIIRFIALLLAMIIAPLTGLFCWISTLLLDFIEPELPQTKEKGGEYGQTTEIKI